MRWKARAEIRHSTPLGIRRANHHIVRVRHGWQRGELVEPAGQPVHQPVLDERVEGVAIHAEGEGLGHAEDGRGLCEQIEGSSSRSGAFIHVLCLPDILYSIILDKQHFV